MLGLLFNFNRQNQGDISQINLRACMFKEKTLFILGAGTSAPYGYPLGKELIRNIIHSIRTDYLHLPTPIQPFKTLDNRTLKFTLDMPRLASAHGETFNADSLHSLIQFQGHGLPAFHGCYDANAQLSQINELNNLAEALEAFDPVSITESRKVFI
jgi:hypothetical protein